MEIKRSGAQPSGKGPAKWSTGTVRIDPLFSPPDPARVSGALVTFEPGARTAWHTHPLGQTLLVSTGLGWVQRDGGAVEEIRPGDVVWFPPGEKHWHGATATTAMEPYRGPRETERLAGRMDGARLGRTISKVSAREARNGERNRRPPEREGRCADRRIRLLHKSGRPSPSSRADTRPGREEFPLGVFSRAIARAIKKAAKAPPISPSTGA